jgi:hypothetical protein
MPHIRGAPYHPMTQGKIERWHLTLKNRILLENYYLPGELELRLNVYEAATEDLAALAKKLPVGRLYSNGKGFVPNVRQSLYSERIATLAREPQAALIKEEEPPLPVVASGLPNSWDEITPGHLVVAQETLEYRWWEAIVLDRNDDMLTLRFRDYPKLPKFVRHRAAVALISTTLGEPPSPSVAAK